MTAAVSIAFNTDVIAFRRALVRARWTIRRLRRDLMPMRPKTHAQRRAEQQPAEARRETRGTSAERGYGYRWQKARAAFLALNPLCLYCQRQGRTAVATVVDHAVPHKNDPAKFWDTSVWTPACVPCHQYVTNRFDGGHGTPQRPREGNYLPPQPGELAQ